MDNFNFPPLPFADSDLVFGESQLGPTTRQDQHTLFSGLSASARAPEQTQMAQLPPNYDQMTGRRPLLELSISRHRDAFQALYSCGTAAFTFLEGGDIPLYDSEQRLSDIDELVRRELGEAYVPLQPTSNAPPKSEGKTSISIRKSTSGLSFDESLQHAFTAAIQPSPKKSHASSSDAVPPKKMATKEMSTTSLIRVGVGDLSAMPSTVAAGDEDNAQRLSGHLSKQEPAPNLCLVQDSNGSTTKRHYRCYFLGCGKTYKRLQNLETHIFAHTGTSIYKCTYKECGDNTYFAHKSGLDRHIRATHTYEKFYYCRFCFRRFVREDSLERHLEKLHPEKVQK